MKPNLILFVLLAFFLNATAANNTVPVGRYTVVTTEPTSAQVDLLSTLVHVRFPKHIISVGQALEYLLLRSGYRLSSVIQEDPTLSVLYQYSLPDVHQNLGPLSLRQAMITLVGAPYVLVEDPIQREISFKLKESPPPMVSITPVP